MADNKKTTTYADNKSGLERETDAQRPLQPINFKCMAAAGLLIIIGFVLMLGSSTTAEGFDPDIFSTRRIVIGPLLSFLGFVGMGFALMVRNKK